MSTINSIGKQQGVITIFITMMMLLLITVLVTTAYSLSTMNLRAIGNVQAREQAISAATLVIERIVAGGDAFTSSPAASPNNLVDINDDTVADYIVDVAVPQCIRATQASSPSGQSVSLIHMASNSSWNTIWEIDATATDAVTGAQVRIVHGIRVLLNRAEKNAVCS
jgi:Tfp pilus assembly protein PilX